MSARSVSLLPLAPFAFALAFGTGGRAAHAQAPLPPPVTDPTGVPLPRPPGPPPAQNAPSLPQPTFQGTAPAPAPGPTSVPLPNAPVPASGPNRAPAPGRAPGRAPNAAPNAEAPPTAEAATSLDALLSAQFVASGGLTAEDVARQAVSTSFDVRARQAEIEIAAGSVDQALYAFFPRLALSASYTRLSPITAPNLFGGNGYSVVATPNAEGAITPGAVADPAAQLAIVQTPPFVFPVILNNYLLTARLTVPFSDYVLRLSQSYAAATHAESSASANERAARLKTALDAKNAYYQWVRARLQVLVAEQSLGLNRSQLLDAQRTFQAGTASRADVLNAESRVANAELLVERQRNLASLLEDRLRTLTHDKTDRPYAVGEDVRSDPAAAQQPAGSTAEGYNEAVSQRLEIRALDETAYSLREQAKVARAGVWPRLDGFGDVTYANPNQRYVPQQARFRGTWSVGLQLSWSPNDVPTAMSAGSVADARAAQIEAQRNALRDGLRYEVMQSQNGLREAQVAMQTTTRSLAAAEESYRVRRELFKNGRATNLEVTDAENNLLRARYEAINARVDLRIALVNLEHALGRDVKRATP